MIYRIECDASEPLIRQVKCVQCDRSIPSCDRSSKPFTCQTSGIERSRSAKVTRVKFRDCCDSPTAST